MRKLAIFAALPLAFAIGCGNSNPAHKDAAVVHDAPADAGGPDASCFNIGSNASPTHEEIINACTTAQKIYVTTKPALQLPDGGLPPLDAFQ
jgi:hypothetical protein